MQLVIRPSFKNAGLRRPGRRGLVATVPMAGLAAAMFIKVGAHKPSSLWIAGAAVAAVLAGMCLLVAVGEIMFGRNASISVNDETYEMTDLWGRKRAYPRSELKSIRLSTRLQRNGTQSIPIALTEFVSDSGQTTIAFRGKEFSLDDLERLSVELHVPIVGQWPS